MDEVRFPNVLFFSTSRQSEEQVWQPRADIYRLPGGWLVKFELAGIRLDDIRVSTRGDRLSLQGTRRDVRLQECLDCHRLEIDYCQFERSVELPGLSESAEVRVSYIDGMLIVRVVTEAQR